MANKLSERENEFLTQMKIEAAASNKNEQLENLNLLENYIANLPTTKDRNYAIYKVLNDPKFGFDNPDNWNVSDKSYWSDDNEKDYTPPDVEAYQRQKDGENFWNFESKNYWMNRSPKELERKALKAGYSDLGSYLNDVGKVDTYNRRNKDGNTTSHAEILAIQQACKKMGDWRLEECEMYVTLEPCPMCAGAIINSRIKNVYFGAVDEKNGAVVSAAQLFDMNFTHKPIYESGILSEECAEILSTFFKNLRKKKAGEEK